MPTSAPNDTEPVVLPGGRDVRGALQTPTGVKPLACTVGCPPDPGDGGDRRDPCLRAIADALCDDGIACLRIDYGPCDDGRGERRDVEAAVALVGQRYAAVGLVGYSFGATLACLVAASDPSVDAVSALAPPAQVASLDALETIDRIPSPCQLLRGERDTTVDPDPAAECARKSGCEVTTVDDDHLFRRSRDEVARRVADFQASHLS